MPAVAYLNKHGVPLAQPSPMFSSRFPVLCLHRDHLQRALYGACLDPASGPPVEFLPGVSVERYEADPNKGVRVYLSNNTCLESDVLVAADGIHSTIRRQFVEHVTSKHCGYVYFRATLNVEEHSVGLAPFSSAFESWGDGQRFGYVPLQAPDVFWFASIPAAEQTGPDGMATSIIDEATKQHLLRLFEGWSGQAQDGAQIVNLQRLILSSPASSILRTPIRKVPDVEKFPWQGNRGRVILLGDSAHAVAPNLAQGAGLAIEDALVLATNLSRVVRGEASLEAAARYYELARKPRAKTVQSMADLVATVGHIRGPLALARNYFMLASHKLAPTVQSLIFERAVSMSLGGDSNNLYWSPPVPKGTVDAEALTRALERSCLLGRVLGATFSELPSHVRKFRAASEGEGVGIVSVE